MASSGPSWDGQLGAHQKQIPDANVGKKKRTFLADKIRYMLKSPRTAYRIYKMTKVRPDGESLGCIRPKKSDLRKGDRITCSIRICISMIGPSAVETEPACCVGSRR
jgi:hypothetical protein